MVLLKNKGLILIILLGIPFLLFSQVSYKGRVINKETQQAIPFVNLQIENTLIGTYSNMDGSFALEGVPDLQRLTLKVSAIGYQSQSVDLKITKADNIEIELIPESYSIDEIEVEAEHLMDDPVAILKKTIRKLKKNHPNSGYTLSGVYQDIFSDYSKNELIHCINKQVDIAFEDTTRGLNYKLDVKAARGNEGSWSAFRYNKYAVLPQYHIPDYGTDHLSCLLHMNPIMNPKAKTFDFVGKLNNDFIKNHYFHRYSVTEYNGHTIYWIRIFPTNEIMLEYLHCQKELNTNENRTNGYFLRLSQLPALSQHAIGEIAVDVNDFAVLYFEYCNGSLNDRYKFSVEYQKHNNCYYPSNIYLANKFFKAPKPDYSIAGEQKGKGLFCDNAQSYYKKYLDDIPQNDSTRQLIKKLHDNYTIFASKSKTHEVSWGKGGVKQTVARLRLVEELMLQNELKDHQKMLHHRYLKVTNISASNGDQQEEWQSQLYSDYSQLFRYLGDVNYQWMVHGKHRYPRSDRILPTCFYKTTIGDVTQVSSINGPLPVTSEDEWRYLRKFEFPYWTQDSLVKGTINMLNFWNFGISDENSKITREKIFFEDIEGTLLKMRK